MGIYVDDFFNLRVYGILFLKFIYKIIYLFVFFEVVLKGIIVMWSGDKVLDGWVICDKNMVGVLDLSGKFIMGIDKG